MLYRFKSQATADVVMLEPNARQLLGVIGKTPSPQGIVTVDQIPAAISALETAIHRELENGKHNHDAMAAENHDEDQFHAPGPFDVTTGQAKPGPKPGK